MFSFARLLRTYSIRAPFWFMSSPVLDNTKIIQTKRWCAFPLVEKTKITGVFVHPNGYIYYTSQGLLWKLTPPNAEPECLTKNLYTKDDYFTNLEAIVWDGNNILYLTDQNHKIVRFEIDTGVISILSGTGKSGYSGTDMKSATFSFPSGLALHHSSLFVTDCHRVKRIDLKDEIVCIVAGSHSSFVRGSYKNGNAELAAFSQPGGIVVSSDNSIFICDSGNHCIRKIQDGQVYTVAGIPQVHGHEDGPLQQALFDYPQGLYQTKDGVLLVADANGLRHVDLYTRKVTTLRRQPHCQAITVDTKGKLYLGGKTGLFWLCASWRLERLLWIGCMKENASYCNLAKLPRDIIRELNAYLST